MKFVCGWLRLIIMCITCLSVTEKVFYISMFDAYPKDNIDDSSEIQLVIYEAISYGLNVTIAFGFGTSNLSSKIVISNATNLIITE
ncbi:unnamed protein product [Rotaria sp. Silwood1]|nr:unnamed protein product [Rotaria sp. Silwood1]CAF3572020.1 unnamed protein product [Rotaria sp. Silwood1]CAF3607278.1 unnamed protein product [Rotaria sp. Silwood1]CAF4715966.1 unnamed protein product [Rotaria sp. Silwood1]